MFFWGFFLLKVLQVFKPRLERGFGFPEELQPRWDDKASIQVDSQDGTGAPGGPREVLFYKERKKKLFSRKKPQQASLVQGWCWLLGAGMVGISSTTSQIGFFHVNNVRFDPTLSNFSSFIQLSGWFFELFGSALVPSLPKQKKPQAWNWCHSLPCPGTLGLSPARGSL